MHLSRDRPAAHPPTPLEQELLPLLEASGPVPFASFMEAALYHPRHGYYASRVPGPASDYRTSPSLTPWFGRLLARAFLEQWEVLGRPGAFTVVEAGAGGGGLAAAVVEALSGPFAHALRWRFVERFDTVREVQQRTLSGHPAAAEWVLSLDEGTPVEGCVLANEVLDNMPVHVFEVVGDGLAEVYVAAEDGRLVERLEPPRGDAAESLARRALPHLERGDRLEVRPAVEAWCRQAARTLRRGHLVVIDYGDPTPRLWLGRPAGSLVTYRDERLGGDPLASPGLADITAHVDFTHLGEAAAAAGFEGGEIRTQRDFLNSLGLADVRRMLRDEERTSREEGRHAEALGALADRSRVEVLVTRGGLGDLLVFTARRREGAR